MNNQSYVTREKHIRPDTLTGCRDGYMMTIRGLRHAVRYAATTLR